jgi:hypothetical protein
MGGLEHLAAPAQPQGLCITTEHVHKRWCRHDCVAITIFHVRMKKLLVNVEEITGHRAVLTYMIQQYRKLQTRTGDVLNFEVGRTEQVTIAHRGELDLAPLRQRCATDRAKAGF